MLVAIILFGIVLFVLAYRFYGRWLDRQFDIDPDQTTPAHKNYDGLDYVRSFCSSTVFLRRLHRCGRYGSMLVEGLLALLTVSVWLKRTGRGRIPGTTNSRAGKCVSLNGSR